MGYINMDDLQINISLYIALLLAPTRLRINMSENKGMESLLDDQADAPKMIAADGETETDHSQQTEPYIDEEIDHLQRMSDFKTFSKGLMDIALLSANANQLRAALEYPPEYQSVVIKLIILSLFLQMVAMFVLLAERVTCNKKDYVKCHILNTLTTVIVMFIIVVNIFIATFGVPIDMIPNYNNSTNSF